MAALNKMLEERAFMVVSVSMECDPLSRTSQLMAFKINALRGQESGLVRDRGERWGLQSYALIILSSSDKYYSIIRLIQSKLTLSK